MKLSNHLMIEEHITGQKQLLLLHPLFVSWTASMNHRIMLVWLEECAGPTTPGATLTIFHVLMMEFSVLLTARISSDYFHE